MDNLTITETPDTDGDGVPDTEDESVNSVLGGQVDVGSGPTSIANDGVNAGGSSLQDLVNVCAVQAGNHGQYVIRIGELADDLEEAGVITKSQGVEMKNGAAFSRIGK